MTVYGIISLLFLSNVVCAQVSVKEYFTKDDQRTNPGNSYYYKIGEKAWMDRGDKNKWLDTVFIDTVKTYYTHTNKIRSRSFYRDGYQEGAFSFYHENGRLQEKGTYKENQKIGYIIRWTDKGTVKQTLQFFYEEKGSREDSFRIINYWDNGGVQIIKDGAGYCVCDFKDAGLIEEGKVVGGHKDSVWRVSSGDTLVSFEHYKVGEFLSGESTYKGKRFSYEEKFVQAEFPNRMQGLMKFLQQTIRYPVQAKRTGVEGRVFVKFYVDDKGIISDLTILKGVNRDLDNEAMRVIKLMPPWVPGKTRGVPAKSVFVLPIYFKLDI